MNSFLLLWMLVFLDAYQSKYITWSLENGTYNDDLKNAILQWQTDAYHFVRVKQGDGDVKIYFKELPVNDSRLGLAYTFHFGRGHIYLKTNISDILFYVMQHEMGHILNLSHRDDEHSIMYPVFRSDILANVTEIDRELALDSFLCDFDSVTLLNGVSYFVFAGNRYKRIDLNSLNSIEKGTVWHSSIHRVDAMYRNLETGHYVILSDPFYFEFDFSLQWLKQDRLSSLFPYVPRVDAVLPLRNGSVFVFSNTTVYKDHQKILSFMKESIYGAFQARDDSILIVTRRNVRYFDKNFNFKYEKKLCESEFSKNHCCLKKSIIQNNGDESE